MKRLGALETGGTTTRVAVADSASIDAASAIAPFAARASFATSDPATTLGHVAAFFRAHPIDALGIAAFGPLDLVEGSPTYGALLATPKPGWSRYPLRHALEHALQVPVMIDTDVGAAALAEQHAALSASVAGGNGTLAYVTVGTGVGVGLALGGRIHHGALHPEAGHLRVARASGDVFAGLCPFHGDCLEGLASGPALAARAGGDPARLPRESPALRAALAIEADYLAQLVVTLVGLLAPHRIVMGGGVLQSEGLLDAVRGRAVALTNGYAPALADGVSAAQLVVPPRFAGDSGLVGALLLAAGR